MSTNTVFRVPCAVNKNACTCITTPMTQTGMCNNPPPPHHDRCYQWSNAYLLTWDSELGDGGWRGSTATCPQWDEWCYLNSRCRCTWLLKAIVTYSERINVAPKTPPIKYMKEHINLKKDYVTVWYQFKYLVLHGCFIVCLWFRRLWDLYSNSRIMLKQDWDFIGRP